MKPNMFLQIYSRLIFIFILTVFTSTGHAQTNQPVTVQDGFGKPVTLATYPTRIVSLAPSHTEILFAMGLGEKMVGVTDFCDYPLAAQDIAKVGGFVNPSLERILDLRPHLIIAVQEDDQNLTLQLNKLDIPVFMSMPKNIPALLKTIDDIGKLTGHIKQADSLHKNLNDRIRTVADKQAITSPDQKPLVFLGNPQRDGFWLPGPNTFGDDLIHRAGGRNLGNDGIPGQWNPYSLELVVKKNPEIIVVPYNARKTNPDELLQNIRVWAAEHDVWQNIRAVQQDHIYTIDENLVFRVGPRLIVGLEQLSQFLQTMPVHNTP